MHKILIAGSAAIAIAGSTVVYAQHRPWFEGHSRMRITPEDRAAYADARIAAVHAGLKLTPDQEKLWPPVEAAVRDFAKLKIDSANARANSRDQSQDQQREDPVTRLRARADNMTASAAALRKIADTADPLYKTLDEGQKRRLAFLTHRAERLGGEGWRHRWMERGMDRGEGGSGHDRNGDHDGRPERL